MWEPSSFIHHVTLVAGGTTTQESLIQFGRQLPRKVLAQSIESPRQMLLDEPRGSALTLEVGRIAFRSQAPDDLNRLVPLAVGLPRRQHPGQASSARVGSNTSRRQNLPHFYVEALR